MNFEQEMKMKAAATDQYSKEGRALGGACNQAIRQTLRDRVENQRYRSTSEANRAERLGELLDLLDRNPEVARILDLLDQNILLG